MAKLKYCIKKKKEYESWGRAGEGNGADGEKLHDQDGHGQSSLFPSDSPASRMMTHWDLLGGSYMQYSPVLQWRGANLTLGQCNPLGNTPRAVPASPRVKTSAKKE